MDPDLHLLLKDPDLDPDFFDTGLQDATKKDF
jgi:hypothetical protein